MTYTSLKFMLFAAATLLLYYLVGRKGQKYVLLLANIAFFVLVGPKFLPFILFTILVSYFCARGIGSLWDKTEAELANCTEVSQKKEIKEASKKKARTYLILAFIGIVGVLVVCKYSNFVANSMNSLLSAFSAPVIPDFKMILPIGISFYTFMAVSYLLDVFWKRYPAEKNLLLFAVYLSYFPHVVQGPIDRYDKIKPQIESGVAFSYENLTYGAQLVLWGLIKKLVLADRIGLFVDTVYDGWQNYTGVIFVVATVLYSIQIYADFSGCIDIVTGISEMLGIKLTQNFNHPYFSKTMPEFWRRWHMSLMEWFKDYIYLPVSVSALVKKVKKKTKAKNRKKAGELFATCFPTLIVWLATGIWHGASWTFVAWGLFHAILIIGGTLLEGTFKKMTSALKIQTENFGWKLFQMARTFTLCCIGRVFFRADSLASAFGIFARTFSSFAFSNLDLKKLSTFGMTEIDLAVILIGILILWTVSMLQERMGVRETIAKQNIIFRWIIYFAAIYIILIFGMYGPSFNAADFIYAGF
ncbi:MAG: MBOAT family protein [Lachnospiraceae bacterium]|nr:MBOAT family protein [Lachnospiraceae bacterium]